jgi:hypothetical protein
MLAASVDRVTLAKDVTGKCEHFLIFNEIWWMKINQIRIQCQIVMNLGCMQFHLAPCWADMCSKFRLLCLVIANDDTHCLRSLECKAMVSVRVLLILVLVLMQW